MLFCLCNKLRRFVARRGKPQKMHSDNAKNFIGAKAQLNELANFLNVETNKNVIKNSLHNEGISWQFIPPKAPHFGGLWEAAVKSVKFHLVRVLNESYLT